MKRKTKRFDGEEGSQVFSEAQEKWLGGADRTDPYILARMRRAVPDEAKPEAKPAPTPVKAKNEYDVSSEADRADASFKGAYPSTSTRGTNLHTELINLGKAFKPRTNDAQELDTSAFKPGNSTESDKKILENIEKRKVKPTPAPKVKTPEAKTSETKTSEAKIETTSTKNDKENPEMVKKAYEDAKKMNEAKETTTPKEKTFEEKVAELKTKEAKTKDPYSGNDDFSKKVRELKNKAAEEKEKEKNRKISGYKSGGTVKRSSASSRADGIATKGHTRGTMVMCGGGMTRGKK